MQPTLPRVAVVGGTPNRWRQALNGLDVQVVGSSRDGGTRRVSSLVRSITAGSFVAVVICTRWLAHSDTDRVRRACQASGTRLVLSDGGRQQLRVIVLRLLRGASDVH